MSQQTSPTTSAWADGVAIFAGAVLATVGVFQFLEGLSAVAKDDVFVTTPNYVFSVDITGWGWIHMILGAAAIVTGIFILTAKKWALIVGVGLAILSAIANFMFLPYYPLWAIVIIAFDIAVIWALSNILSTTRR